MAISPDGGSWAFAVLGIHADASVDEVRVAFRRKALQTHPDKQGGSAEAFNAVQQAHDVLIGHLCASSLGLQAAPDPVVETGDWAFGGSSVGAFDPWSSAEVSSFEPSSFDPWSTASAPSVASSFDPWSSASFDQQTQAPPVPVHTPAPTATFGWSGDGAAPCWTVQTAAVVPDSTFDPHSHSQEMVVRTSGASKRKRALNAKPGTPGAGRKMKHMNLTCEDPRLADGSLDYTRYGVYGFRPEDSGDESEEIVTSHVPTVVAPPMGMLVMPPMSGSHGTAARQTGIGKGVGKPPPQPQKQFYCAVHKRLRFEDCLVDDGEGNPVCRPGMECP